MQTAKDWHIEDNERGKKLTIFPTEGRKERGGRGKGWTCLKMKQISLTLNSDYSVVKIQLTTGLDNYPDHSLAIHSVLFNSFGGAYVRTRTEAERRTDARSDETCRKVVRYVVEPLQYFIRAALLGNLIASGPEQSLAAY